MKLRIYSINIGGSIKEVGGRGEEEEEGVGRKGRRNDRLQPNFHL